MDKQEINLIAQAEQETEAMQSPFAKYPGILKLGETDVEVYVSDTGKRLISLRGTMKAIANRDGGNVAEYIGVNALKPYINKDLLAAELTELHLPGNPNPAKCLEHRQFLSVCRAYVSALGAETLSTDRQREIAIRCSALLAACADIGLEALIDEATGYQYVRREDELQVKLRLYIAEELREWEKTFPDELWEEFGRLTGWKTPLSKRPKWWGKLVIELIYDTLDPDIAKYLRENKPPDGVHWHRQMTEHKGVRALVSRCYEIIGMAKSCKSMQELKYKVNLHYKTGELQFQLPESLYEKNHKSDFNKNLGKALNYSED